MANTSNQLIVRADADTTSGTGHVMRCLALAQAWNGPVTFASAALPDALVHRIEREQMSVQRMDGSSAATAALARRLDARWVVIDGYAFDGAYEQALRDAGSQVLAWDDHLHTQHKADLVLNQNIHAAASQYEGARALIGTRYACLRREFWRFRDWKRPTSHAKHVLVTIGGSDPNRVTAHVLASLVDTDFEVTAVMGAAAAAAPEIRPLLDRAGWRLVSDAPDMAALMASADLAISAAGSTAWELLFMQLPSLVVTVADNQREIAAGLGKAGAAEPVGWWNEFETLHLRERALALASDSAARKRMSEVGRALVDGLGGTRVVAAMQEAA